MSLQQAPQALLSEVMAAAVGLIGDTIGEKKNQAPGFQPVGSHSGVRSVSTPKGGSAPSEFSRLSFPPSMTTM